MLQKISIYNNNIFVPFETYLITYSYKKSSVCSNERFSEGTKIEIPAKHMYGNEILLEAVSNYTTGLKTLIILVFHTKKLCSIFSYCDSTRKKLREIVLPFSSISIEDFCKHAFVSNGPTFLYYSNNSVHLFSAPLRKLYTFDDSFLGSNCKEFKFLQFKCFGPFNVSGSFIFISLLIASCHSSNRQSIKIIGFVLDTKRSSITHEQLSLHLLVPQCYETVLRSIDVLKIVPFFKTNVQSLKDVEWTESISIICTQDECLVFINAVLTYCCKLTFPLSEVMFVKSEINCNFSSNINLVLVWENKTVLFVSMKKNITCEVIKHWSDIEAVMTSDILRKGSKQVLLLKETHFETWMDNCILYDMMAFIPIDFMHNRSMPDECLKTTIAGLTKKVQIGKSVFKEIESEISQKSAATLDVLVKLHEFKVVNDQLKHSYKMFQDSLVDLILSNDENKTETVLPDIERSVTLLEKNQKFIENRWVISLLFKNESKRRICHPSIKIVMKDCQVMCAQKLFVHNSDNFSLSDKFSWEIESKGKFTILISFEFLLFHSEDVSLILTWYNGSTDEFDSEIFILEDKKVLSQCQLCLQTKIALCDVINCNFKRETSFLGDMLFSQSSKQRLKFCVLSLYSNIRKLEEILMKKDSNSGNLQLFQSASMKCISFSNEKSHLFGVYIVFQKFEDNVVGIEAYIKNEIEILSLIQYLYEVLPEDIIILPQMNYEDELTQIKKTAASSLKHELDLLVSLLTIHNISEELRMNYSKLMSSQMIGTITIPKQTYNRIRRALIKREFMTDSILKTFSCCNS